MTKQEVEQALQELVELGLVAVVGYTSTGEALYAAKEKENEAVH